MLHCRLVGRVGLDEIGSIRNHCGDLNIREQNIPSSSRNLLTVAAPIPLALPVIKMVFDIVALYYLFCDYRTCLGISKCVVVRHSVAAITGNDILFVYVVYGAKVQLFFDIRKKNDTIFRLCHFCALVLQIIELLLIV